MKKLIAWIGAAALAFSLTACGGAASSASKAASSPSALASAPAASTAASSASKAEPAPAASAEATVSEQVLYENNGLKITAKSLEQGGWLGPELKVLVENDGAQDVTVQVRRASVNGYMTDPSFSCDVTAGKKVNDTISLMDSTLEECGIDTITDIEFSFHVFDAKSWDTVDDSEIIHLQTSAAGSYQQVYDDAGTVLVDQAGVKIVYRALETDGLMGPRIMLYLENNTEQAITVQQRDMSINGFMIDGIFSCELEPGKKAVSDISMFDSDLEENGITALETVDLSFHVFTTDGWNTLFDTDTVTIDF